MLHEIQRNALDRARKSAGSLQVGPFVLRYHANWSSPFVNYAIPETGVEPDAADIDRLIEAFAERDHLPRLEYLPACAPGVEQALLAAGFVVENRAPVMCCEPGQLVAPAARVRIEQPESDADFFSAAAVQHVAYAEEGEVGDGEVQWLRDTAAEGGLVLLACDPDGTPVGAGVCSPPVAGLSELAGLAVVERFRGRGIGAALAGQLTASGFDRGYRAVWLEPGDADIQRIYDRLGYRVVGEKLNISRPAPVT